MSIFKNWKLRKVSVKLLGLTADFEHEQPELKNSEDASNSPNEIKSAIETVQDSVETLEKLARETKDKGVLIKINDQILKTLDWCDSANSLVEKNNEIDEFEASGLQAQLGDLVNRIELVIEMLTKKLK